MNSERYEPDCNLHNQNCIHNNLLKLNVHNNHLLALNEFR